MLFRSGPNPYFQQDSAWRDLLFFNEYFHGETGQGLGASHQTGWTALVGVLVADRRLRNGDRAKSSPLVSAPPVSASPEPAPLASET